MRGVTGYSLNDALDKYISTHTPHARRDHHAAAGHVGDRDFYSHASCEA